MLFRLLLLAFTAVETQGSEFAEHMALLQRSRRGQIQDSEDLDGTPGNKAPGIGNMEHFDILEQQTISTLSCAPIPAGQPLPCSGASDKSQDAIEFAETKGWTIKHCAQLRELCTTKGADLWLVDVKQKEKESAGQGTGGPSLKDGPPTIAKPGTAWEGWGAERLSKSVRQTCPRTCQIPCSELRQGCADVYRCPVGMSTALTWTLDKCDAATCTPMTGWHSTNGASDVIMDNDDAGGTAGGDEDNPWTVLVTATAHHIKLEMPTDAEKYNGNPKEYEFKLVFSSATRTVTMQWAQTSWPTSKKRPSSFRPISISDTKGAVKWAKFKGLWNCGSKAAFCSYRQWAAVGQYGIHKGGIKAWPPSKKWGGQFIADTAELQVSIPKGKNL